MLARERTETGLAPDTPAAHAMPVVQQFEQRLRGDGVRAVRLALRLLDDHLDLAGQLVRVDERVGVRVRLDGESCGKARRRQHRVVARVIVDRAGVQVTALRLGLAGDVAHAAGGRALEVHVLEHVRHAHHVVGFVEVSRGHPGDDRDHRHAVVGGDEYGQAVAEPVAVHPPRHEHGIEQRGGAQWTMRRRPASAQPRRKLSASPDEISMPVREKPRRASLCMNSCTVRCPAVGLASRICCTISSQLPT